MYYGRFCQNSVLCKDGVLLFNVESSGVQRVRIYCRGCWSMLVGSDEQEVLSSAVEW